MGLLGREKERSLGRSKVGFASERQGKPDVQKGDEVTSHVTEHRFKKNELI